MSSAKAVLMGGLFCFFFLWIILYKINPNYSSGYISNRMNSNVSGQVVRRSR